MFYITKKDSETGKKLAVFEKQLADAFSDQKKIAKEIGAIQWRSKYWVARGGFSSVMFANDSIIDKRIWKNVNKSSDEWMPRLNTPEGKAMNAKFELCRTADYQVLNNAIWPDASPFDRMGFCCGSKEFYGVEVKKEWGIKMPADCEEVTETVYDKTFKREKK